MNYIEFYDFLLSRKCFDECTVSHLDKNARQHYIDTSDYTTYLGKIASLMITNDTIKIENYENITGDVDKTVHVFYNKVGSVSFDTHTDPVDVVIKCVCGTKTMEIDGSTVVINEGEEVLIPAGTPHRALNTTKAIMYSYGINDTETLNILRKDNRDL